MPWRRWSTTSRFLLNVPLFGREALHPDVDRLVGDFTSSLLLDIDLTGTTDAASRAYAVQDAMRDRRRALQLSGPVGAARPEPSPRHPGARAGRVHQRARTRRIVLRRRHRRFRRTELDHLAGPAGFARRSGHRVRRRRDGELGCPRGRFPGRRRRRDVRPPHRRTAPAGLRRRRLDAAGPAGAARRSARGARRGQRRSATPAERRCTTGSFVGPSCSRTRPRSSPVRETSATGSCAARRWRWRRRCARTGSAPATRSR